jgi:hypothetical protein
MIWRSYWLGFSICTLVALIFFSRFTTALSTQRPPRPNLPTLSRTFPSEYSAAGSDTAHDIFLHGLFNIGARLRRADVFLIGSSHIEFGLSAAELGLLLSRPGHAVSAYNLGLGCGESAGFGLEILAKNGISGRTAIAEAGMLNAAITPICGPESARRDVIQAYTSVLKIWTKYLSDWALDPVLPCFVFAEDGMHVQRFLYGMLIEREWKTGDVIMGWHPVGGAFYPGQPIGETEVAGASRARGVDWKIGDGQITVSEPLRQQAAALRTNLTMTFVPWARPMSSFEEWYQAQSARIRGTPTEKTRCFVAIPADGLLSWDGGNHLTGKSRSLATKRLAAGFRALNCGVASDRAKTAKQGQ